MSALILTLFVSGGLVFMAIIGLVSAFSRGDHEHGDRLRALPLDDDNP
jgi:hypothetical protein